MKVYIKKKIRFKLYAWVILFVFFCCLIRPDGVLAQGAVSLPPVGTLIAPGSVFEPVLLKGLKIYPDNPLRFDFVVDVGQANLNESQLELESLKLMRYFLAALAIPGEDMWVNLSPHEKDRIIPERFGYTEMGRDLLAQDYILKQVTASLAYPETKIGQEFWDKIYMRIYERYQEADIPTDTFNKVWVVPASASVHESGDIALIMKSRLKVLLESDYSALRENVLANTKKEERFPEKTNEEINDISSRVIREIIIPEIEKEINDGEHFANLRQIYHAMILATWFKRNFRNNILGKFYVGKNRVGGIDMAEKNARQKIYDQYLESFKVGVYNYIKEEYDPTTQQMIPKKYFSGGADFGDEAMLGVTDFIKSTKNELSEYLKKGNFKMVLAGVSELISRGISAQQWRDGKRPTGYLSTTLAMHVANKLDVDYRSVDIDWDMWNRLIRKAQQSGLTKEEAGQVVVLSQEINRQLAAQIQERKDLEVGTVFDLQGHRIDGTFSRGRSSKGREIIVMNWEKDIALRKLYKDIISRLGISPNDRLSGVEKGNLLREVFEAVSAAIKFVYVEKHSLGNFILAGETIETGGVCRHMGLVVAAILEKMIKDGFLTGSVFYIRGRGHAWAVYKTSNGEFVVLDVAQKYFGNMNKEYYSRSGNKHYADDMPLRILGNDPKNKLPANLHTFVDFPRESNGGVSVNEYLDANKYPLADIRSFEDLFQLIRKNGLVQGSSREYDPEELIKMIQMTGDDGNFRRITNANGTPLEGLRGLVQRLLVEANSSFEKAMLAFNANNGEVNPQMASRSSDGRSVEVMQGGLVIVQILKDEPIQLWTKDLRTCSGVVFRGVNQDRNVVLALAHVVQRMGVVSGRTWTVIQDVVKRLKQMGVSQIEIGILYDKTSLAGTILPSLNDMNTVLGADAEVLWVKERPGSEDFTPQSPLSRLKNSSMYVSPDGVVLSVQGDEAQQENIPWLISDASAIKKEVGGIDFNPELLEFQSDGSGIIFDIPFDPQIGENREIDGFIPLIFNILPINLPVFLGISEQERLSEERWVRN